MKFQSNLIELIIVSLLLIMGGLNLGAYLYAPKPSSYLLYALITFFPALTLIFRSRLKNK